MVDKFQNILNTLEQSKGEVTLFALLKMDEYIDKWTVVFCAPWSTPENRGEIFNFIKEEILRTLTPEEISEIARVGIFPKDEHLIEELLKFQTGTTIQDQKINGNKVHYAHIIKSNP